MRRLLLSATLAAGLAIAFITLHDGTIGGRAVRLLLVVLAAALVVAAAAPRPVLLITAGKVTDEERAARYIRAGSPATVEVWSVPGAGHTQGLATRPREWEHRVTAFLESALLTPHDTFTP